MRVVNLDWFDEDIVTPLYADLAGAFSLRKFNEWSNAVLKIRRSSDNATAFVFFDGASTQDEITTSSYISTTSNTTPDTTTLATWVSTDDAFVEEWLFQQPSDTIRVNFTPSQTTTANQPKFITSGVIETKNGKPNIVFDGTNDSLETNASQLLAEIGAGNDFTMLSVTYSNSTSNSQPFFFNYLPATKYLNFFNDRTGSQRGAFVIADTNALADLLATQNSADQRLQNWVVDGSNRTMTNYFNGTQQTLNATWTGDYLNNAVRIGRATSQRLNGGIQEILFFPSQKTADLSDLNNDINTYYSIY